jgi:hypothetical protein
MPVNRIIDAPAARLTPAKSSLATTFAITSSLFIALFIKSAPVLADTLLANSVYFDSEQTLNEVVNLSSQHDNEGIAKLIRNGHISDRTPEEQDIVVLISSSTPESPTEFRFLRGPTTFWTLGRNVATFAKPIPIPTPLPTPTTESTPLPAEPSLPTKPSPPSSKQHNQQNKNHARFDDDRGKRIWHRVDGKWKWYPVNNRHVTGWPAATLPAPAANPRVSPIPVRVLPASSPLPTPTPLIMNEGTNLYNSDRTQPFKNYGKPVGQ